VRRPFRDLVSIDFFTVPTASLRVLFVFVVLAHHRRRVVHFNVTQHPTAHWTVQQLVDADRYLKSRAACDPLQKSPPE
jgi:putative transposase